MSTCFTRLASPINKFGSLLIEASFVLISSVCLASGGQGRASPSTVWGISMSSLTTLKFKLVLRCYNYGLKRSKTNLIASVGENGLLMRLKTPWLCMFTPRRSSMKEATKVNWLIHIRNEFLTWQRKWFGSLPLCWESIEIASASTISTV